MGANARTNRLIPMLENARSSARAEAVSKLAATADASTVADLLDALRVGGDAVRLATLEVIQQLHTRAYWLRDIDLRLALESSDAIDAVAACLQHARSDIVLAASVTLEVIGTPSANASLRAWRVMRLH